MTPKEKAKELVEKYFDEVVGDCDLGWSRAKKCALIAVDELKLNAHNNYMDNYWQQVKQEIEKL